jgi:hypothetical protein
VLYVLVDHHNKKTEQCNPSIETIGRCAGVNRQSVPAIKRRLRARGLIDYPDDSGDGGRGKSTQYTLLFVEAWSELGKPKVFHLTDTVVPADRFVVGERSAQRTDRRTENGLFGVKNGRRLSRKRSVLTG